MKQATRKYWLNFSQSQQSGFYKQLLNEPHSVLDQTLKAYYIQQHQLNFQIGRHGNARHYEAQYARDSQPATSTPSTSAQQPDKRYMSTPATDIKATPSFANTMSRVKGLFNSVTNPNPSTSYPKVDGHAIVKEELEAVFDRLRHSVVSSIPQVNSTAQYLFQKGIKSKRMRPTVVLLLANTVTDQGPTADALVSDLSPAASHTDSLRRRLQRMAEITETIHVASLLHDDVIDNSSQRRGVPSANAVVGTKTAVLVGDFLLARACQTLASLQSTRVVSLIALSLQNLVEGELLQAQGGADVQQYIQRSYYKTASLLANSCEGVGVLGGCSDEQVQACFEFGKNLGVGFQIIDDVLDFVGSAGLMGKPVLNDLKSGIATAPVLLVSNGEPELLRAIERKFSAPGDIERTVQLVHDKGGVEAARVLAEEYMAKARQALELLPETKSEVGELSRAALRDLTHKMLERVS